MEQKKRITRFPFAAPESKGSFKKICQTAQKKEKLNEERNVSFDKKHKTSSIQNSMSDKQMTAYGKFSEEGVWDYDSWYESKICPDPPLPPFSLQQNKLVTQSPVSSSKTRLSWTTVQHDPSSLPYEGYAWPLPNSAQVVTDPHIHNLESGIGHLTSDAPQAEKEDFNEHQKKFSEEGVQAKVPSKRFLHYPDIFLPPINSAKGGKGEKRKNESEDHHGHHIGYSVMSGPLSKCSHKITDTPMYHPSRKKLLTTKPQGKAIVPPIAGPPGKPKTQSNSAPYSGAFEWDASSPHEPWNEMPVGGAWSRPSPSDSPFSLSSQDSWLDNRRYKSKIRRRYHNNASKRPILEKRVLPTKAHSDPYFKLTDTPLSLSSSSDKLLKGLAQSNVILPSVASHQFPQNSTMFPDGSSKEKQKEKAYPSKVTEPELPCSYGLTHEMTGGGYVWPGSISAQRLTDPHIHNLESGIGHLTSDAPQAEKEDFNEHQKRQTSISEKQMTAGEMFSEEGYRANLVSKRFQHYPNILFPQATSAIGGKGEKREKEREHHHSQHIRYSDISGPPSKHSRKMTDAPIYHQQGGFIVPPIAGPPGQPKPLINSAPYPSAFKWDARSPHEPWNEMSVGGAWSRPSPSDSLFTLSSSWLDNRRHESKISPKHYPIILPSEGVRSFKLTDTPQLSFSSSSGKSLKELSQSKVILPSIASHSFPQNSTMFLDGSSKEKRKEKAYPSKVTEPELPCVTHEMTGGEYVRPGSSSAQVCADLRRCSSDITGESLKKDAFELAAQSQSELGSDHSTIEKMRPPVIVKHSSILPVSYQLQQPRGSSLGRTADLYSPHPSTSSPYLYDLPQIHAQGPFLGSLTPFQSSFSSKPFKIKCTEASHSIGSLDDYRSATNVFYQPHFILSETGMIKNQAPAADASTAVSQDNTREMDLHETTGPSTLQLFTSDDDDPDSAAFDERTKERDEMSPDSPPSLVTDYSLHLPSRKETDDGDPSFDNYRSDFSIPTCSQSTAPTVCGPPCPQDSPVVPQDSTVCTEGSRAQDAFEPLSVQSEGESGDVSDAVVEMEASVTAVKSSVTDTQPTQCLLQRSSSDPGWTERGSSCLSRSHSVPSLSQTTSPENKTFTRSQSLPDLLLKSSFEEFTPDFSVDEDDETYWFQCSCPGLYQCSVTGLVFHMEGEGDVVYRTVPWDRRLLAQHHKKPAGPLFDIKCLQQSVCQLHLPHCEIRSTGGCEFLSVAHVNDEGIQFIVPQKITETHVIINITGFSAFGNVKDEDSPPDPVRALVLLFYRPPAHPDSDPESFLHVFLLPVNIVVQDVVRTWNKLAGEEIYIKMSPYCKLHPNQEYTLSTCPEDDSVLVQPKEEEFDCDNYDNYFPSFQVILEKIMKHIKLFLRETKSSKSVWERRVCLSSTAVKRSCGPSALNLPPNDRLLDIRSSFIDGISGPVLKSLLDKLLEKTVLTDSERESADEIQNHRDKARFVVDTVRKKGEAASSEMIQFLCEVDPFLCKHLGLI